MTPFVTLLASAALYALAYNHGHYNGWTRATRMWSRAGDVIREWTDDAFEEVTEDSDYHC